MLRKPPEDQAQAKTQAAWWKDPKASLFTPCPGASSGKWENELVEIFGKCQHRRHFLALKWAGQ
jgi:hypothetical protein